MTSTTHTLVAPTKLGSPEWSTWLEEQIQRLNAGEITSVPLGSFTSHTWDEDNEEHCWSVTTTGGGTTGR